ncbi:MAG: flagellar assembly protein FliW [Actinomycetales bacterium]
MTALLATPSGTDADLVFDFPAGIPGFAGLSRYLLHTVDDAGVLFTLRSVEEPDVRLLVVPPVYFFPDYAPEIDDASVSLLGLLSAEEADLFVVVTAGTSLADSTANLLAPIVINRRTRVAAQVILTDDLPLRAPLVS